MPTNALSRLIMRWYELREQGKDHSIEQVCAESPELMDELKGVVSAIESMESFMALKDRSRETIGTDQGNEVADSRRDSTGTVVLSSRMATPDAAAIRHLIPGYEIERELGRGGMGVVYLARQVKLKRQVALKMILGGGHARSDQLVRFRTEAQAVACLRHPNIVHIYEIGEHAGLPFFSLEYIAGGSLADRLDGTPLPPRQAAELVETIARAVHVAHLHGIVHRDLKPENILLQPCGDRGELSLPINLTRLSSFILKITDFGLAKQLDANDTITETGAIVGTPTYMSPEQAAGRIDAIGPLTDVYALGTMLYELLTGRAPFKGATVLDTLELVRSAEPVAPSRLQPKVPRDLDTLSLKCLQKDPDRRYESALNLAEDLGRFVRGEPIQAQPISAAERALRWCYRNPKVAALSAAVLTLLLTVAIGSTIGLLVINEKRRQAFELAKANRTLAEEKTTLADQERLARQDVELKRQAEERARELAKEKQLVAEAVSEFLLSMFESSDPIGVSGLRFHAGGQRGDEITALDLLDRGAERIRDTLKDYPTGRAEVLDRIGNTYRSLGAYEKAEPLLMEAYELRTEVFSRNSLEVAASEMNLGQLFQDLGDSLRAEQYFRSAMAKRQEMRGAEDPLTLESLLHLAWILADADQHDEAELLFRRGLELRRKIFGNDHREVGVALFGLAGMLLNRGKQSDDLEAINLTTEAMQIFSKAQGDDSPFRQGAVFQQAVFNLHVGNLGAAESGFREAAEQTQRLLGPDHIFVAFVKYHLGLVLNRKNDFAAAELPLREAVRIGLKKRPNDPKLAIALAELASVRRAQNDPDEAEQLYGQALAIYRARSDSKPADIARLLTELASLSSKKQEFAEAEKLLTEAIQIQRNSSGRETTAVANSVFALGDIAANRGDAAAAMALYRQAIEIDRRIRKPDDWELARKQSVLGNCLVTIGQYGDAEHLLLESGVALIQHPKAPAALKQAAIQRIIRLYEIQQMPDKAAEWRVKMQSHNDGS